MTTYKTKNIESALSKKGFQVRHGSKHKIYTLHVDESKTRIYTFISHGIKEYGDSLLSKMRGQLKLSHEEFDGVMSCPIGKEELVEIYSEKGLI
jgi:hypothetical protein